jgi:Spy/CpxP family protein refolding chaperone
MQKRLIHLALILSLVFNVAFLGALGYRLWTRRHDTHQREQRLRREPPEERMGLRKEQKEQLDKVRKDFFPRIRSIRMELFKERETLASILKGENPDTNQINVQLKRIGDLQCRIEKLVVFQLLKEKAFLDPQQREVFLQMIMRRMGEMGPGRGPRRLAPDSPGSLRPGKDKKNTPWQNHRPQDRQERKESQP